MNFGGNSFIWILFLLMLMPGGFGCGGDSSFLLIFILMMMMQGTGGCGICEAK